jgi:hypothetical protein
MTWDTISKISAIVSILSVVSIFMLVRSLYSATWGREKRIRIQQKQSIENAGERPGIIILQLTERPVKDGVIAFAQTNDKLKLAITEKRLYVIEQKHIQYTDMPELEIKFLECVSTAFLERCDLVHVFCGGPMPAIVMFGSILRNAGRVNLYHHEKGEWSNWGSISPVNDAEIAIQNTTPAEHASLHTN